MHDNDNSASVQSLKYLVVLNDELYWEKHLYLFTLVYNKMLSFLKI